MYGVPKYNTITLLTFVRCPIFLTAYPTTSSFPETQVPLNYFFFHTTYTGWFHYQKITELKQSRSYLGK